MKAGWCDLGESWWCRSESWAHSGGNRAPLDNDVYFQVGLLTTIAMSSKNAILSRVRRRDLEAQGRSAIDAAVEAAQMRLRPILITSLAFVLGVLPLAIATGAGSGSENAVGRGVIGGMLSATFLCTVPDPDCSFFVITEKLFKTKAPGVTSTVGAGGTDRWGPQPIKRTTNLAGLRGAESVASFR